MQAGHCLNGQTGVSGEKGSPQAVHHRWTVGVLVVGVASLLDTGVCVLPTLVAFRMSDEMLILRLVDAEAEAGA